MGDKTPPIALVMDLIAQLALALKAAPMTKWAEGWRHQVDDHWTIIVNGQRTPITTLIMGTSFEIPPFSCAVEYNGWLAGLVNAFGGHLAAGEAANEEAFCTALERAIDRATS